MYILNESKTEVRHEALSANALRQQLAGQALSVSSGGDTGEEAGRPGAEQTVPEGLCKPQWRVSLVSLGDSELWEDFHP